MSNKIPKELYQTVYEFYDKQLAKGTYISKIADIFNKHFGTQYAESSLRNRYEYQRDLNNVDKDILDRMAEVEKAEHKIALQEMDIISKQKRLQRQQSAIDSQLRYNADKELVAEVFNQQERTEYEPIDLEVSKAKNTNCPIFSISDIHLGYLEETYYDLETAKRHIRHFFSYVDNEIKTRELKEVIISENGDSIEGSSLRTTQLFTIAKVMTEQATIYSDLFFSLLQQLAEENSNTQITVYFVDEDNHSQIRLTGASRGDTTEMMGKVIANDIAKSIATAQRYNGLKNIEFIHAGDIFVEINGINVLFTHGDKYPKAPKQMVQKIFNMHGKHIDVIIHGHYHNFKLTTLNVVEGFMQTVISLPSIVGDTRYSHKQLGLTGLSAFTEITICKSIANAKIIESDDSYEK